jgi:hypothetical protein
LGFHPPRGDGHGPVLLAGGPEEGECYEECPEEACPEAPCPTPKVEVCKPRPVHVKAPRSKVILRSPPPTVVTPPARAAVAAPQMVAPSQAMVASPQALTSPAAGVNYTVAGRARPGLTIDFIRIPIPFPRLVAIPTTPEITVPVAQPQLTVAQPQAVVAAPQQYVAQPQAVVAAPQYVARPQAVAVPPPAPPQPQARATVPVKGKAVVPVEVPVRGKAVVPVRGRAAPSRAVTPQQARPECVCPADILQQALTSPESLKDLPPEKLKQLADQLGAARQAVQTLHDKKQ